MYNLSQSPSNFNIFGNFEAFIKILMEIKKKRQFQI